MESRGVGDSQASTGAVDGNPAPASDPEASATTQKDFPIVGIGASAGGLAAFEQFFSAMPATTDSGIAFVLVQHLAPNHKSILVELVKHYTKMEVFEAQHCMKVRPNCAYVIPPNRDIAIEDTTLIVTERRETFGVRLPIDHLFVSLAAAHRERAICMVLSGTGSDGALGLRAIKGEGGMAMAQSPETAEHDGMPRAAIATGLVDYVLPPSEMPDQLIAYVRHAFASPRKTQPGRDLDVIRRMCVLLRAQTGHDFSQYKETTLQRRLERRMALHQIESPEEYLRFARDNVLEVDGLFRDLLIGVTNFFRDPEAFKVLESKIIPGLLENRSSRQPIRVWVCGCSTGEEAYSLAILLTELIEAAKQAHTIQIFATDIDRIAIDYARAGVYPSSIVADVTPERLARNFVHDPDSGTYRIQKFIRDLLVFSEQDLVKDAPFSKLDLISCRNLLIYLNADVQKRLIPLFHYALRPGGALVLGPSEGIGDYAGLFQVVDRKWKIYQRHDGESGSRPSLPSFIPPLFEKTRAPRTEHGAASGEEQHTSLRALTEQSLLAHYANAAVLINSRGDILHILGRTGKFLEPSSGDATMNIVAMAREGLRRELTVALHKVVTTKQPVASYGVRVRSNGDFTTTNVTIRPLPTDGHSSDLYLVVFDEAPERARDTTPDAAAPDGSSDIRISELESELRSKEEYLQTTLEEMETTNEELKSTNEEMQSVNEELQSTNEELETSKEELQSVNEELSTVNAELQDKVADLSRVNNDMNNLLAGTGVGTVFIDHKLRIVRFTPAATQVINLIPSDVGRPVEHVVSNLIGYDHLVADIENVLQTLQPIEAEVQTKSGLWYLMRVRPYRTIENVIEGAVLTLVDISERKRAETSLRQSEARFHAFVRQAFAAVAELDRDDHFAYVNDKMLEMLGYSREELQQKRVHDVIHPDDVPRFVVQLEALVAGGPDFEIEKRFVRKDGSAVWTHTRVNAIRGAVDSVPSVLTMSFDISERKRLEAELSLVDDQLAHDIEAIARLNTLSTMYSGRSTLQPFLDEVLGAATLIGRSRRGVLQLLDERGSLNVVAYRGFDVPYIEAWSRLGPKQSPAWHALQGRRQIVVVDAAATELLDEDTRRLQRAAGVAALESTPIIGRYEALLGVFTTYHDAPEAPAQRTLRLLDLLARQAADVIGRANAEPQPPKDAG